MRTLTAIVLLLVLTACTGTDDDTGPSGPSAPSAPADVRTLDVTVTDPGVPADPERVAALQQTVSAALASEEFRLDACPLGAADAFVQDPVEPLPAGATFSATVQTDGVAGQVPTVVCLAVGFVRAEISVLPGGVTADDLVSRISGVTMRPAFSEPQPLVGGELVVGCSGSQSSDLVGQCAATWVMGDLAVTVDVFGLEGDPQGLADYVSASLPAWVAAT